MEQKKQLKKLVLSKERISHLTNTEMRNVLGGESKSTKHDFTCSWCTSEPSVTVSIAPGGGGVSYTGPGGDSVSVTSSGTWTVKITF